MNKMQSIDHSTSLKQLKQFLQNLSSSSHPDPYWQSILQSDIRNIIPKHQVSKIQLVKTNLSKVRLILQNLNSFISLQIKKKHLKQEMIDLNENISIELQQLSLQQQKTANDDRYHHYDTNLTAKRKQLELVYKQFTKNRSLIELRALIGENKKWMEYIIKHVKLLQKVSQHQLHEQITNFIATYQSLFNIIVDSTSRSSPLTEPFPQTLQEVVFKSGMYTKIYESKIRQRLLIQKLVEDIYQNKSNDNNESSPSDDYWLRQVRRLREVHNL